jgi:two-component system response regulator FixJ
MKPLVHVVDDDEAIRESLSLLLESNGQPARAYGDAESFLSRLDPEAPGCVVTDVRMGRMNGLELQRTLRDRGIGLPVIIITGHGDVAMAVQALKDGAVDFIEKPFDEDVFLASVRAALDHGRQAFQERRQTADLQARAATMTAREREVMDLVVRGLSNKSMATELAISVRTVEIHRSRVMEKMAVKSLSELVRAALRLEEGS